MLYDDINRNPIILLHASTQIFPSCEHIVIQRYKGQNVNNLFYYSLLIV